MNTIKLFQATNIVPCNLFEHMYFSFLSANLKYN